MNELITAVELAALLRVAPSTVRRWARGALIPTIRITGKVVRFRYQAVCEALQAEAHEKARTRKKGG